MSSDYIDIISKYEKDGEISAVEKSCLSLISTRAFRLSPAKFFAWDMRRVMKRIEQDEKIYFVLFAFEIQTFQLLPNFLTAKQSDSFLESREHFRRITKISQNGRPTALSGLREDRPQYILKTRITELQTSFRLRQFFAGTGTLRKCRLIILLRYFSLTKSSVSDRRKV